MQTLDLQVDNRGCLMIGEDTPQILLIEAVDDRDKDFIAPEIEYLRNNTDIPFALAAFVVNDWNAELSPWEAPPVFGNEPFGSGAAETLDFILEKLLPKVTNLYPSLKTAPKVIGGYSLAALFALWCAYVTDAFDGIAAASPSVWFPSWIEFARNNSPQTGCVYLSLGDAESKTKNKTLGTVADKIIEQDNLLERKVEKHILEWNKGNHFVQADLRTAKAFSWVVNNLGYEQTKL